MRRDLISCAVAALAITVLCGLAYPLLITGVAQVTMPGRADGSLVEREGRTVGSRLIGQDFRRPTGARDEEGSPVLEADPRFFQARPSATGSSANATAFNNQGPNQRELRDQIASNADAVLALERKDNPSLTRGALPVDAVTTSASGIDPHISRAYADLQATRVARERGIDRRDLDRLLDEHTDGRFAAVLGEPGVNVLELNLALEDRTP